MNLRDLGRLFRVSFREWQRHSAPVRAAALTFFIILPLPSLLLLIVSFFALFVGQTHATQQLITLITAVAGPAVAGLFRQLLAGAMSPFSSAWSAGTLIGFSLAGAIGAFAILRDSMNVIWKVKLLKPKKLAVRIRQMIGPFFLVTSLGLIVIAWTTIASTLFNAIRFFSINRTLTLISLSIAQVFLSFALSTMLFAIIYKVLPDRKIHWVDVALSAVVTGVAFTITNYVIGAYVQTFTVTTFIGAAGALFVILLWIYVINLIVLFGAEVSKVYAQTYGPHPQEHIIPAAEMKFLQTLEDVGERIEEAAKGQVEEKE